MELASGSKSTPVKRLLHQNATSLRQLATTQEKRLSQQPPFTVTHREMCPVSQREQNAGALVSAKEQKHTMNLFQHPLSRKISSLSCATMVRTRPTAISMCCRSFSIDRFSFRFYRIFIQ